MKYWQKPTSKKQGLCLLLALIMVLTMIPTIHVHADEAEKFILTDKRGNEITDRTFTTGDPIYIKAGSAQGKEWFGLYRKYDDGHWDSYYYMWEYAENLSSPANLIDCKWYGKQDGPGDYPSEGFHLEPGVYEIWWGAEGADSLTEAVVSFTLTAPVDGAAKLEVETETIELGKSIKITATNHNSYSWVGVYEGNVSSSEGLKSLKFYYCQGRNGLAQTYTPKAPGEYTVLMYNDYGATDLAGEKHITVNGQAESYMSVESGFFAYGDSISVTTKARSGNTQGDWVGLYKKGEKYDPNAGGALSIYWYTVPVDGGTVIINVEANNTNNRASEFVGGEYTLVYFFDGGYVANETIDITITKTLEQEVETPATCEKDGSKEYIYNDGTSEIVPIPALGHDTESQSWNYDAEYRKHYKICARENCGKRVEEEACTFDEGVVGIGEKTYTCTICQGQYTEPYSDKEVVKTETIQEATCTLPEIIRYTYADGTSEEVTGVPLGHDFSGDYVYNGNKMHNHKCQRKDCDARDALVDCTFGEGTVENGEITYICSICSGSYSQALLSIDQTSYPWSEVLPIQVTVALRDGHTKDWVAMYKKGDVIGQGAGTMTSIYYYYPAETGTTATITEHPHPDYDRTGEVKAGEYVIYYLADDGYEVLSSVEFTITKEVVSRTEIEATCENAGTRHIVYSDGTEEDEIIPAMGHKWSEKLIFDEATHTHAYVCENDNSHIKEHADCTFGEPATVEEPKEDQPGTRKYTCTICGGSYTEQFYNKVLDHEEIVTPATCETPGTKKVFYSDGTYVEETIPALGHKYPDAWTFDKETFSHKKVCANDASHVIAEECTSGEGVVNGKQVTYHCTVCGGERVTSVLHADTTTITENDTLMVVAYADNPEAWIGLYKRGDVLDPTNGGVVSIYWCYVQNGKKVNLLDATNYNYERGEDVAPGRYTLYLFGDGGYSNIIAQVDITIEESKERPTLTVALNGEIKKNGDEVVLKEGDTLAVKATGQGKLGKSWIGIYDGKLSLDADFSGMTSIFWKYMQEISGKQFDFAEALGQDKLTAGQYTIVLFADGGKSEPQMAVNVTISRTAAGEKILAEATCTEYGQKLVTYDDGTEEYIPIPPLGHLCDKELLRFDREAHTHSGYCSRCETEITEKCFFEAEEGANPVRYVCTICGGSYVENEEDNGSVTRLYGKNRLQTAYAVAEQLKQTLGVSKFNTILVASGKEFADAQSGAYLANLKGAPILLSYDESYDAALIKYIVENLSAGGQVYILGGEKAVPVSLDNQLSLKGIHNVKRLAGNNRYETNLEILKEAGVTGGDLLVCTGTNFADVLSASAVEKPILMVYKEELLDSQKEFLSGLSLDMCYIIGGKKAVSTQIESALRDYGAATKRLGGSNRYETSVLIAKEFFRNSNGMVLTYGRNFPDGLCGGMLANSLKLPLVLTEDGKYSAAAIQYAQDQNIGSGIVLGGAGLIGDDTVRAVFAMNEGEQIQVVYREK